MRTDEHVLRSRVLEALGGQTGIGADSPVPEPDFESVRVPAIETSATHATIKANQSPIDDQGEPEPDRRLGTARRSAGGGGDEASDRSSVGGPAG